MSDKPIIIAFIKDFWGTEHGAILDLDITPEGNQAGIAAIAALLEKHKGFVWLKIEIVDATEEREE